MMELFVPGFDPTIPIAQPTWTSDSSILDFCQGHNMLYFRLQAKKNMFFSSRDRTTIFLRAVTPSEYADVVTSLQTSVDAYRHPNNDGFLPDHLRLDGIATLISPHPNTPPCLLALSRILTPHISSLPPSAVQTTAVRRRTSQRRPCISVLPFTGSPSFAAPLGPLRCFDP